MAEIIGLVSGILALVSATVKTTKVVTDLVTGIKDAPDHIKELEHDVKSLSDILNRLETAEKQRLATIKSQINPSNEKSNGAKTTPVSSEEVYDTIRGHLEYCKRVLKGVEGDLQPVAEKMGGSKKQVAWASVCVAFTEKSIKEHSSRLSKVKMELMLTMVIDIRSAVLASSTNKGVPSGSDSANDPPPEYPGFDPKIKRRDSLLRETIRRSSVINRFRSSGSKAGSGEEPQDETPKQLPTFSQVVSSTMDDMSRSIASETKGGFSMSTLKIVWKNDLEQIQLLLKLEKETVQNLKKTINDYMCDVFTTSISANVSTMNDIKDAAEGTLKWIDKTPEYIQWRAPGSHQILLLEGKAGSGKSVFTKTLCQTISTLPMSEVGKEEQTSVSALDKTAMSPVVLTYFFNKRVRAEESCVDILKAFVCQYLNENKGDFTTVYQRCKSLCDQWDPAKTENFRFGFANLLDIFTTILQVSKKPVYCVVDAMDECHSDRDLEEFMGYLPSLLKYNEHSRLFMSSRPDWIADNDFSKFDPQPLKIVLHPDVTEEDISQLIELELCRLRSKLTIDDADKSALKKKLTNKAEGMILWVVLAFRRIQDHIKTKLSPTLKWLEKMVEKLPREIFGMYDHIMATIREKYGKTHHSPGEVDSSSEEEENEETSNLAVYGKLVLWVARAKRPLTLKELQFALALDIKDTCLTDVKKKITPDIDKVIGRIPFLEIISAERFAESADDEDSHWGVFIPRRARVPSSTVRFIHQSAREYILRSADSPSEKGPDDGTRFTYPKLDDTCIGNLCVSFLSFKDFDSGPIRGFKEPVRFNDGFKKFLEDYAFLEYCCSYWGYHLNRASDLDDATKAHVANWICNRKNNMRIYFQVSNYAMFGRTMDYVDKEFGLIAAAGLGIEWLVDYLIAQGHNLDERDEWGRTGFQLAAGRGFTPCAEKLANAGADTSMDFLLELPTERMCWDTVDNIKKSLDEGTQDLEETDEFGRTPIFYVCARGDAELLSAVLEKGPNLGFKDKYGRLPIDVTLDLECRELMLEKMKKDGIERTPEMSKKIACLHDTFSHETHWLEQRVFCDFCGRGIRTFYFHCCDCSTEDHGFNVCSQCHNLEKYCLDPSKTHKLLPRVTADWLVSSLDYSPNMATAKVESPIKWKLDRGEYDESEEEDENENNGGDEEITPVPTTGVESVVYEKKDKRKEETVVRVQAVEGQDAGCCKCVVQ
ncbi:hypothetical protein TWF718_008480 [Orbilia javanica]|uniref:NACHT domain-containing protein n=1 Tax=Orbilia javanica TaxID=47235 RepID=A0AAN8RCH0_9PEZI